MDILKLKNLLEGRVLEAEYRNVGALYNEVERILKDNQVELKNHFMDNKALTLIFEDDKEIKIYNGYREVTFFVTRIEIK